MITRNICCRIKIVIMISISPGPNFAEDPNDFTSCSWGDNPQVCVFGYYPVPITDVRSAQVRVHSDTTKAAISLCEADFHDVSFFSLAKTQFGHPSFDGEFEACKNAEQLLKDEVGNLTLSIEKRKELEQMSSADSQKKKRTPVVKGVIRAELGLAHAWFPQKLVEPVTPDVIQAHKVLVTKLTEAPDDFQQWIAVR